MKIGLTGSIACGKSTVSSFLRSLGYYVADADGISHALTAKGGAALPALKQAFGNSIFNDDGKLDRRVLGSLVFSNEELRLKLNAILHPMIIVELNRQLAENDSSDSIVFGDVPLLFECGLESSFDQIWVIAASRETQIHRIIERDHLSAADAAKRIDSQMPLSDKTERADAVISTEQSIEETQRQIQCLLQSLPFRRNA